MPSQYLVRRVFDMQYVAKVYGVELEVVSDKDGNLDLRCWVRNRILLLQVLLV